jgi:hypothetical protein
MLKNAGNIPAFFLSNQEEIVADNKSVIHRSCSVHLMMFKIGC